jgi:hypothetical protein
MCNGRSRRHHVCELWKRSSRLADAVARPRLRDDPRRRDRQLRDRPGRELGPRRVYELERATIFIHRIGSGIRVRIARIKACARNRSASRRDGRGAAELLVEGSWFDGDRPIRMDDPAPPVVLAPIDPKTPTLGDPRRLNLLSARADTSLRSDWKSRGLDVNTLNTQIVARPSYPYSLDSDPSRTLENVTASAGMGRGGFPVCTGNDAAKTYVCQ